MRRRRLNRRQFLRYSGAGLAAGLAPALPGIRGANERIGIGILGCGVRGTWAMQALGKLRESANVSVTALCDVWRPAREAAAARAAKLFGHEPATCSRYQDVLARSDVDAVVITTPDFAHSPMLVAAIAAGKDAYCEKPMATSLAQANAALHAVRESKQVVQIGTQRRSEGRFRAAAELLHSGVLGKIVAIDTGWHDKGPRWLRDPADIREEDVDWHAFLMDLPQRKFDARRLRCWQLYLDYTLGPVALLGSHLIDVATWLANDPYPRSAVALGGTYLWKQREHADTIECLWEYPSGFLLRYTTRLGNNSPMPEVTVYGSHGTFDTSSWGGGGNGGGARALAEPVTVPAQSGVDHVGNWLDCIRQRAFEPNAPVEVGHAHSVATILAHEAWRSGRRQLWDAATRQQRSG